MHLYTPTRVGSGVLGLEFHLQAPKCHPFYESKGGGGEGRVLGFGVGAGGGS